MVDTSMDLKSLLGDVTVVALSGTPSRAHSIAKHAQEELFPSQELLPVGSTERYSMFVCGSLLSSSHGMGKPSVSILLHELAKLFAFIGTKPVFVRVGTCGGIGLEPGTVVISSGTLNGLLEPHHRFCILGKTVTRPSVLDTDLAHQFHEVAVEKSIRAEIGLTMSTDDFYEEQGRLDGAICEHSLEDKMEFLKNLSGLGVKNIEMEAGYFAAFTHHLGIKAGVICVALINRLEGDTVRSKKKDLVEFEKFPIQVLLGYIKKHHIK